MALVPFLMEDFAEWPTVGGAAQNVGNYSGTGWSDLGATAQRVEANANFASGKAVSVGQTSGGGAASASLYALPGSVVGSPLTYAWNYIRVVDSSNNTPVTLNDGQGVAFINGAGESLRLFFGDVGDGEQNTIYLYHIVNSPFAATLLHKSTNTYQSGVKYPIALVFDDGTGDVELWVQNVNLFAGNVPSLNGVPFTSIRLGNFGAVASGGRQLMGDVWAFGGEDYANVGPAEIRNGFPASDGPDQDWAQNGGAGSGFSCIDGLYSTAPTDFISSGLSGDVSNFGSPADDTNVFEVFGAMVRYYAVRTDVTPADMDGAIGDGSGFTSGATTDPPQAAYQRFSDFWGPINPNSGVAWAPADVSNAEIQFTRTS